MVLPTKNVHITNSQTCSNEKNPQRTVVREDFRINRNEESRINRNEESTTLSRLLRLAKIRKPQSTGVHEVVSAL